MKTKSEDGLGVSKAVTTILMSTKEISMLRKSKL